MISKQKEIFNKLADERLDEIFKSDEKVNAGGLVYRYKGPTADAKFDKFHNALNPIDKIGEGEVSLPKAKKDQMKFEPDLGELKKKETKKNRSKEQKSKKMSCIMLKCFTKQGTMLLNFLMIIFQWYLKQDMKQLKEQDLKY